MKTLTINPSAKITHNTVDATEILRQFVKRFPDCVFKPGIEFDGNPRRLVWNGSDGLVNGIKAFNCRAWDEDPKEKLWIDEVHKDLVEFAHKFDCYWESYDCETFFLYRDYP